MVPAITNGARKVRIGGEAKRGVGETQRAHRTTAGAEWAPSRRAGFATKVASVVRTCHSVQSGACTKQPPCARCVWLSARAACARHITPCVRARCAFGSPPAHHHSAPSTRKRRQRLGGQVTPSARGARRRAPAGRSAPRRPTLDGSPPGPDRPMSRSGSRPRRPRLRRMPPEDTASSPPKTQTIIKVYAL